MKQLLALITVLLVSTPAYCADREEARVRVREAAYQATQRHQVTERYRYYVPVSAFAQRRGDDPRVHTKYLSQPPTPPDPSGECEQCRASCEKRNTRIRALRL